MKKITSLFDDRPVVGIIVGVGLYAITVVGAYFGGEIFGRSVFNLIERR